MRRIAYVKLFFGVFSDFNPCRGGFTDKIFVFVEVGTYF